MLIAFPKKKKKKEKRILVFFPLWSSDRSDSHRWMQQEMNVWKVPFCRLAKQLVCVMFSWKQLEMFLIFARNGTNFKIRAWKVLLRIFNQEEGSVTAFFTCGRIWDLCIYSHQSEGILVLYTAALLGASEWALWLSACWSGETIYSYVLSAWIWA